MYAKRERVCAKSVEVYGERESPKSVEVCAEREREREREKCIVRGSLVSTTIS